MAHQEDQLDLEKPCCSICLDPLKDKVTIPCGHSYCRRCIEWCWEREDKEKIYQCPECRRSFEQKPVLVTNTMLKVEMEEQEMEGSQDDPDDHCTAGPGDVECDFCTKRKRKATMSCLQCLVSCCEQHLQPHYEITPLKKHKLVDASIKLQEIVCPHHNEIMKVFCRTDQQCICYLCSIDEHKSHNIVSAAAEMTKRQTEFRASLQKVKQRIQEREESLKVLEKEVDAINSSAEKAIEHSEKMSTELVQLIEQNTADLKKQIISQQIIEVRRATELDEKQKKELTELKKKDAELEQLLHITNETMFLQNSPSSLRLRKYKDALGVDIRPLQYFEDVTTAVSEASDKVKDSYMKEWNKISKAMIEVDCLVTQDPKKKSEFSQFSFPFSLDPNTANAQLLITEGNRKVIAMKEAQFYPNHPERFMDKSQILSSEFLTRRCYFEVEWSGLGAIVAVAYKDINRTGDDSAFGNNDRSWALESTFNGTYIYKHDSNKTPVTGPHSSRIGVFLDHRTGTLSFYSVSRTMTLLHRVQTTFTRPLYGGLCVRHYGATVKVDFPQK
ncbi:Tripartite motif-containing protein 16 Estrogen-responsive B box protein [Channa argus]|uniref:Tripartite motif-containing protein 16 Estrogen-responsive B box protein n=1 Tax=Channa argus TaxID=215402 RepID=A0A6G1QJQ4_CHAAH|nr:Tripartite motif-containing protein 16 Estrogen-responsive B box protein [Channa argus]